MNRGSIGVVLFYVVCLTVGSVGYALANGYPHIPENSFGYDNTATGNNQQFGNVIVGSLFNCPEDGILESITARLLLTLPKYVTCAIYNADLSYFWKTDEVYVDTLNQPILVEFPIWNPEPYCVPNPTITAGEYILVVWADNLYDIYIYFDLGNANQGYYTALDYIAENRQFPDPLDDMDPLYTNDDVYCIYATYTPESPPPISEFPSLPLLGAFLLAVAVYYFVIKRRGKRA